MFSHRNVTVDSFQRGDKVWAVYEGRVVPGCINGDTHESVRIQSGDVQFWVSPTVVFKRPTEYHLLRVAVDEMIEDLQRDTRELLVESAS